MFDPFAFVERHLPRMGAWAMTAAVLAAFVSLAFERIEAPAVAVSPGVVVTVPPAVREGCLTMPDGRFVCDDGETK